MIISLRTYNVWVAHFLRFEIFYHQKVHQYDDWCRSNDVGVCPNGKIYYNNTSKMPCEHKWKTMVCAKKVCATFSLPESDFAQRTPKVGTGSKKRPFPRISLSFWPSSAHFRLIGSHPPRKLFGTDFQAEFWNFFAPGKPEPGISRKKRCQNFENLLGEFFWFL